MDFHASNKKWPVVYTIFSLSRTAFISFRANSGDRIFFHSSFGPFFHFGHIGWPTYSLLLNHLKIQSHQFQFSLILSINVYSPRIVVTAQALGNQIVRSRRNGLRIRTKFRISAPHMLTDERAKKREERIVCTQHGIYDDGLQLCAIKFFLSFSVSRSSHSSIPLAFRRKTE